MLSHVLTGTGMPQLFPFGDKRKLSFFRSAFLNCSYLLSVLARVLEKCAGFVLLHLSNTNLLPESRKSAGMHLLQEEENSAADNIWDFSGIFQPYLGLADPDSFQRGGGNRDWDIP